VAERQAFNEADVTFARQALAHHQQGVDLASMAADRAADDKLKKLAQRIIDVHEPEIARLSSLLEAWGQAAPDDPGFDPAQRDGLISGDELAALAGRSGKEFDRAFAAQVIRHREAGVRIAASETERGTNPGAREVAAATAGSQQSEIAELRAFSGR
jgi:uncharacterized protein (DUF305 family)